VGTGQQEVDIINHSHTIVVVMNPGMGDEIQAIKAGILEIADIFVINKADREGAHQLKRELQIMLEMADANSPVWKPPIIMVENIFKPDTFQAQIHEAAQRMDDHHKFLISSGVMEKRMRRKIMAEINEALRTGILDPILEKLEASGDLESMMSILIKKESDPHSLAEQMAKRYLKEEVLVK
jgi:LAO/AO transport system kinase